jgi:hypothetical protein
LQGDAQRSTGKPAPAPQPVPSVPKVASPQPAQAPGALPAAPRQVALSPTATLAPAPNRSGYTINQTRPDGSRVIVQQTLLPSGDAAGDGLPADRGSAHAHEHAGLPRRLPRDPGTHLRQPDAAEPGDVYAIQHRPARRGRCPETGPYTRSSS